MRTALIAVSLVLIALNIAVLIWPQDVRLLVINARAGCFPWSPKEVEFKQGMTICPGQRAIHIIELPRDLREPEI